MDFNLTKKNLESWAAAKIELDNRERKLDIFMMVDEETGDEYLTIQFGPIMKLIQLESPVPKRHSRSSHGYGKAPQYDIYKKPVKCDEEKEEASDD